MTMHAQLLRMLQQEDLNFLLTNRIPRRLLTRFMGWFSQIEQPLVRDASIGIWRCFSDLDLSEAKKTQFKSMHDCFIRELKDGARPVDPDPTILTSPCDAIVGASRPHRRHRPVPDQGLALHARGSAAAIRALVDAHRDGRYVTLRLTSSMYHRFHAPHDCRVEQVTYISGDTWNVNPIALKRIEKLFCKNERAVLRTRLDATGQSVTLVPVAAMLVASIRLHFLDMLLHLTATAAQPSCRATRRSARAQEMGWFQHGSTIVVFAPGEFSLCDHVREGATIRMGQPLMRLP